MPRRPNQPFLQKIDPEDDINCTALTKIQAWTDAVGSDGGVQHDCHLDQRGSISPPPYNESVA